MLKLSVAQRTILRLIRNTFVRVNPALGFKRQTPYRRWVARVLKAALDVPPGLVDKAHELVAWAVYNAGNHATHAWDEPEWLRPLLDEAIGSGRRHARDGGGWIWHLIEDIAAEFYVVVASSEHYRERLEHPFYAIQSDERLFRQELLPLYTALLQQYKPEDRMNDLILSLSWQHLALRLLEEWEQKAPVEEQAIQKEGSVS
jgi:hypothetical protein